MKKMLVVDDVNINRTILGDVFADEFEVVEAGDGSEAIEKMEEHDFDVILTDLIMPNMNGFEFLEKIDLEHTPIPVFVITPDTAPDNIRRAFELGALDCVARPFDTTILKARVDAILSYVDRVRGEEA